MTPFVRMLALALALAAAGLRPGAGDPKVLRIVPHSNLAILDPIWTTAYMSRNHGYMIYDTLFGTDEKSQVKPQMVDSWTVSPDNRLWTFTLRTGLEFHDGKPVTGEDVIASIAALGQARRDGAEADDLRRPHGFAHARTPSASSCARPAASCSRRWASRRSNVPFIMPKRVADTDAFKQIEEHIGSGPVRLQARRVQARRQGGLREEREVRAAQGAALGHRRRQARLRRPRRVEPRAARRAGAGQRARRRARSTSSSARRSRATSSCARPTASQLVNKDPLGFQYMARFNHLHPPFDNPKVRQAALAAMHAGAVPARAGRRQGVLHSPARRCSPAARPTAAPRAATSSRSRNMKKAQELLKASGYDGTPVVILKPTDLAAIQKLPDVAAQLLRQAGFKVDLQAMDWQTLVVAPREEGAAGARAAGTSSSPRGSRPTSGTRSTNAAVDTRGEKSLVRLGRGRDRSRSCATSSCARPTTRRRRSSPRQIQVRAFEIGTHVPLGEYVQPARRAQEHQRLRDRQRQHLLEPEEELSARPRIGAG